MIRLFVIILLGTIVLSGCKENSDIYSGIEKNDIEDIYTSSNIEFIYVYKGHTDQWAATYHVYKSKNNGDLHSTRLILKYIGKQPKPTGEIKFAYETEGGGGGSGTVPSEESGIYILGKSGGNGFIAAQNSLVKVLVDWNGNTESIELKSEISR